MRRRLLVIAPLIALLCLLFVTVSASAAGPAPVIDLRAQKSGTSVILTWTHSDATADHYEVWWSDSPYAAIGDAGMVMIATVTPTAAPSQATYTDTASGVGNSAVNSFYAVRGVTEGGEASLLSNRAGEFDFGLNGVQPTLPIVDHCGPISADEVWGPNAVHLVTCAVSVAADARLTLAPGAVVKFLGESTSLSADGELEAKGSATAPIVFTSLKDDTYGGDTNGDGSATSPVRGDWGQIKIAGSGQLTLDHAIVRFGGSSNAMIYADAGSATASTTSVTISNSTIEESNAYGLRLSDTNATALSNLSISNTMVRNNRGSGIYTDGMGLGDATIISSSVSGNASTGIHISGGNSAIISDSVFSGNNGWGAWITPNGTAVVTRSTFSSNAAYGLTAQASSVSVINSSFAQNATGLSSQGDVIEISGCIFDSNTDYHTRLHPYHTLTRLDTTYIGNAKFGFGGSIDNIALAFDRPTSVYVLDSLSLDANSSLTIAPGVVVKLTPSAALTVDGILDVQGTTDNPIVFTSLKDDTYGGDTNGDGSATSPVRGDWGQIKIAGSGQLTLDHAIVRFGGGVWCPYGTCTVPMIAGDASTDPAQAVDIQIDNSVIEESWYVGVELSDRDASARSELSISNSLIRSFGQRGVRAIDDSGHGALGTVTLTSNTINGGSTLGAEVYGAQELVVASNTFSDNEIWGATLYSQGVLTVRDNLFVNNANGFSIEGREVTVKNNSFNNQSGSQGNISVLDGTLEIDGNTTSGPPLLLSLSGTLNNSVNLDPGFPSYGFGVLSIAAEHTFTIPAGTILKGSQYSRLVVRGTLEAPGTASQPIVFTSSKDDLYGGDTNSDGNASSPARGDWCFIQVEQNGHLNLSYNIVRYGGHSEYYYRYCPGMGAVSVSIGNALDEGAVIRIDHSTIEESATKGLYLFDSDATSPSSLTCDGCTLKNNTGDAIAAEGNGVDSVVVSNSSIWANGGLGLSYQGSQIAAAENNWWGSPSGPAPYGSGNGISYSTCWDAEHQVSYICQYLVDADPWLGKEVSTGAQLGNSGPTSSQQAFVADPVNTANGNYAHQHADLAIATRGLPLDFARAYNSLNPALGPLGYGWTHNWNMRLTEDGADGSVAISFADGHSERWTWTGTAYDGGPGVFGALLKNGDGSFGLTQKDQTRYHFVANGRLEWAEDKNANRTTLAYDGSDRLVAVTEPAGRALTLAYASPISSALISSVTDNTGRSVGYTYDANSDLVIVTDVTGQPTTFTYDTDHRLLTASDANTHRFVRNVYDANARVTEQYDALDNKWTFAYDEPAHKTLVTDPRGYVTTYQYDGDWRLTSEKDALNYTAAYAYDADNNRIQVTDKRGNATDFAYDTRGNVTLITDPLDHTRSFTYDTTSGRNNLLSETDPRGHTTTYTYDGHSNLLTRTDALGNVSSWTYTLFGQIETATDARTFTTHYTYDAYGYPATVTDPLDHITSFVYDSRGRKTAETDAKGRTRSYTYDLANRLLSVTEPLGKTTSYAYDVVGNRTAITENGTRTTQYAHDAKDRLVTLTDPLGHTTTYGYDTVDNQTSMTDALGHTTTLTYDAVNRRTGQTDALSHTTSYAYDANGNRTSVTDANNKTTGYAYDALNRLTQVTDAASGLVQYGYDEAGNRISLTDANNHTTTYAYDELNRLTSTADPLSHITSYGYDAASNRTSQVKPDGTTLTYAYDALNRLATITYPGGSVSYAYDEVGNRTTLTDPSGVTSYAYDDLDRLIQVASPNGTVDYGYDLFDNRTALTYPGSKTVSYAHDLAGRLTTVTDWAARVTTYSYDDANRPTGIAYPNGVQAAYSYDNADRLLSVSHNHPTHGSITSADYIVDAVGNRLSMTDPYGTTGYTYDNLYRLTGVTYPDGETVGFAYDPMGNRTSLTSSVHGATGYTYDAADRLLTAGATTFTWDANDRMTGKGAATYAYNPLDRLTQIVDGAITVGFAYNGDGVRLSKTVDGATTSYLQDLQAALPVVLTETTAGQTAIYLYGTDLLAQIDPAGNPAYYHADGLGSTRALSDAAGQRTDSYAYDVFGATRNHTGLSGQPFAFTGEQVDESSGLVFLRARYYDSLTGRFLSPDVLPGSPWATQTLGRFVYCSNNPVSQTDPSGNMGVKDALDWLLRGADIASGDSSVTSPSTLNDVVGTAAGELGYSGVATGSSYVGAAISGVEAANTLNSIWRNPSDKELAEQLARANNTTPDDPTIQLWVQTGGAQLEYRQTAMPGRVMRSANTVFESVPGFSTGYKLVQLPGKLDRIWQGLFGVSRQQDQTALLLAKTRFFTWDEEAFLSGGTGWGGPPSKSK